jgi:tRNA nucleotidyltransferase/poly(A) polymerase
VEQSPPHIYDVWEHTLNVLQYLEEILAALNIGHLSKKTKDLLTDLLNDHLGKYQGKFASHFNKSLNMDRSVRAALFFAALYHDVEKPNTKSVDEAGRIRFFDHDIKSAEVASKRGQAFNLSSDEIERIKKIVKNHMRFHFFTNRLEKEQEEPSRKAIYRFFRDSGEAGVDLVLLGLADLRGTRGPQLTEKTWTTALDIARIFLKNYFEKPEETITPPRLLNGNELMNELNLEPGPIIGQLLEAIREGQAIGDIKTREQAIEFAHKKLKDLEDS